MKKERSTSKPSDNAEVKEAQRILDRVASDSESVGTSSFARTANKVSGHFSGSENPEDDHIEVMGKRIGRGLSAVAFIILAAYIVYTYVLK